MDQILTAFGIDARLIVIQIINFAILLAVLWYFLYEPVLTLIRKRQEKIEQGVRDAEAAAQLRGSTAAEREETLQKATQEAEAIVARASAYAKEREKAIVADAEQRAASLIADATQRGEEAREQLMSDAEADIAKTAVLAAEKIMHKR